MGSNGDEDTTVFNILNIPALDLRNFCQDELLLAAELSGNFPEARSPKLIVPTIDKNIFNTSQSSWKQTYRRRLRTNRRAKRNTFAYFYQTAARLQISNVTQSKRLVSKSKHHSLLTSRKAKVAFKANLKKAKKDKKKKSIHVKTGAPGKESKSSFSAFQKVEAEEGNGPLSNGSKDPPHTTSITRTSNNFAMDRGKSNAFNFQRDINGGAGVLQEPKTQTPIIITSPPQYAASSAMLNHAAQLRPPVARLKDRARNMWLRQKVANNQHELTPHSYSISTPNAPHNIPSLPHSEAKGNDATQINGAPDIAQTDEQESKNLGAFGGISMVGAEAYMLKKGEEAWLSSHKGKTTFVGGGLGNDGWDISTAFGRSNPEYPELHKMLSRSHCSPAQFHR